MDWKEKLSALSSSLPEGEDIVETPEKEAKPNKQNLRVTMEKKGRGGKTATFISGFTFGEEEVEKLAMDLKKKLGVGGSFRPEEILLQGDVREKAIAALKAMGHNAK